MTPEALEALIYDRIVGMAELDDLTDRQIHAIAREAALAFPIGVANLDGSFVHVVRIPKVQLVDQWGNPYEGLVIMPELRP